jgi:hypothetical protein
MRPTLVFYPVWRRTILLFKWWVLPLRISYPCNLLSLSIWKLSYSMPFQTVKFGPHGERVPRTEILAEFLSAHFQENPTKSAYFWWTNDLFCLLRVGPCERKLWKWHFRPSRVSKFLKFSNVLPSFPCNCHLRWKVRRAKIILYSLDAVVCVWTALEDCKYRAFIKINIRILASRSIEQLKFDPTRSSCGNATVTIGQALKYILQGRLTKCPMTLSLGRTYVRWPSVQFWLGNKSEWHKWISAQCINSEQ